MSGANDELSRMIAETIASRKETADKEAAAAAAAALRRQPVRCAWTGSTQPGRVLGPAQLDPYNRQSPPKTPLERQREILRGHFPLVREIQRFYLWAMLNGVRAPRNIEAPLQGSWELVCDRYRPSSTGPSSDPRSRNGDNGGDGHIVTTHGAEVTVRLALKGKGLLTGEGGRGAVKLTYNPRRRAAPEDVAVKVRDLTILPRDAYLSTVRRSIAEIVADSGKAHTWV